MLGAEGGRGRGREGERGWRRGGRGREREGEGGRKEGGGEGRDVWSAATPCKCESCNHFLSPSRVCSIFSNTAVPVLIMAQLL